MDDHSCNGRNFGHGINTVFFPASGYRLDSSGALLSVGSVGYYWSATSYDATYHYLLYFFSDSVGPDGKGIRALGCSVRCVAE